MSNKIAIVGAGGHGKVIADIAGKNGYTDIVFLDDNAQGSFVSGYLVAGKVADASAHRDRDFVVAIGNAKIRQRIQDSLSAEGFHIVSLIHPNATVGSNVTIGEGTVVMAGAVLNPCCCIGKGCIINTCASVDHDCVVKDYVHIAVGAHIAGTVSIGERTWIGIGACVSNNLSVTGDCIVGAGAVVVSDLRVSGTYVGVPAKGILK